MMQDFIENGREEEFFKEEKVELKGLTKLSEKTGQLSAAVTDKEKEEYDEICVYYAEEDIQYKEGNQIEDDFLQDSGRNFLVYVLGKKNDNYKILRISTPVVEIITASNEGFSTTSEAEFEQKQIEKSTVSDLSKIETLDNVSNDDTIETMSTSYSEYSQTCIYFTKEANKNYYNAVRANVSFDGYCRNVLSKEFSVSYYGSYPEYLKAAAVAVKSYSYYYTTNPKWSFSPYYANMVDDTRDQDFQYNYYSTICSTDTYKTYCKEAYAYAKARLMVVKSTEKIFETHYNANGGGYHSGILSQNGILTLAKEGYTCGKMLKYYYDNSEYTGNKEITLISAD